MEWLLVALPGVACAAMMLLICGPMMFGKKHACSKDNATKQEITELREEIERLRADGPAGPAERDRRSDLLTVTRAGERV